MAQIYIEGITIRKVSAVLESMRGFNFSSSDEHPGLQSALRGTLPGVPVQHCQVHLQRNAQACNPKVEMRESVAADIRVIFNTPKREEAERLLEKTVENYRDKAAKLAVWMEGNLPDGFEVLAFPAKHHRRLRTTNMVERLNREIRRRTRVSELFPNEAAPLRLVSAILMEVGEEWESADRAHLKPETD